MLLNLNDNVPPGRYYAPAQGKVLMCEGRHGSLAIEYRGRALRWQEISAPIRPAVPETKPVVERATRRARNGSGYRQRITRGERQSGE